MRRKKPTPLFIILVVAVSIAVALNAYLFYQQLNLQNPEIPLINQITNLDVNGDADKIRDLEGFSEINVFVQPEIIFLTKEGVCNTTISLIADEFQTYSIQMGQEKKVEFRPTIHDIVRDILEEYGINVEMAKIERMDSGTYYAKLVLNQTSKKLILDIKPSDAIAIAVRFDAPIYINDNLLEQHGEEFC